MELDESLCSRTGLGSSVVCCCVQRLPHQATSPPGSGVKGGACVTK